MTDTTHLGLPFIEGSQAQKHVTHNEALRILDSVVQIGVLNANLTAPPLSPAEGDRHIVATGATGAWAGHAKAVAVREDGAWRFLNPKLGWCAWSDADGALLVYDGATWTEVTSSGSMSGSVALLGVNDTASAPNLLTVKSNAALFNAVAVADGGTGHMRVQISKEASAKTASVVFSDAFSGRAEFGLIGSDAFKLKVSNDGTTFVEALTIDQSSGNVAFPRGLALSGVISPSQITSNQNDYNPSGSGSASILNLSSDAVRNVSGLAGGAEGRVVALLNTGSQAIMLLNESASSTAANRFALGNDIAIGARQAVLLRYDGTASRWYALARPGGREVLTGNRTYYVRTDGSDSNDGLSNVSGGAFLTIQKAYNTALTLDLSGYAVTIQIADGTYTSGLSITSPLVGGTLTVKGNATTPDNVLISTAGSSIYVSGAGPSVSIQSLKVASSSGDGIVVANGANVSGTAISYGTCAGAHLRALSNGVYTPLTSEKWSGNAQGHYLVSSGGIVNGNTVAINVSAAISFSLATVFCETSSIVNFYALTYSGSAVTGTRYGVIQNSVCNTYGGGASYFPGSAAGNVSTGGLYA